MLFLDKSKVDGDTFKGSPINLQQLRKANPNISIPDLTLREMKKLEKVADDLGYDVVPVATQDDIVGLIGDSFKEKKLTVTSCTKKDGKWVRVFTHEKVHGEDLEKYRRQLRGKRDELLAQSDWTQSSDSPLSDKKKAEWAKYRQELRDLPEKYDHPVFCKYPTAPKGGE
tara:strand:+ start:314 stop:823 length:510 start_codon:yes stop_codon:yes gene_type:complete